jgi:hypothetical protein
MLIKRDIKDAFRHIPLAIGVRPLLGFTWEGVVYHENCLSFGLRTAPAIFNLFAEALHWILLKALPKGCYLIHYLDDFIFAIPGHMEIKKITCIVDNMLNYLGVPINEAKSVCGTDIEILGYRLNTRARTLSLPISKQHEVVAAIQAFLAKPRITLLQCQEIGGSLSWASKVIFLGRSYSQELWSFTSRFSISTRLLPLNEGSRDCLNWWISALSLRNGVLFYDSKSRNQFHLFTDACDDSYGGFYYSGEGLNWLLELPLLSQGRMYTAFPCSLRNGVLFYDSKSRNQFHLFTDACDDSYGGFYYSGEGLNWLLELPLLSQGRMYTAFPCPTPYITHTMHINTKEALAVADAMSRWSHQWRHATLYVHTDSTTVFASIRKTVTIGLTNYVVRDILATAAANDITIEAHRLPGIENGLADALSRADGPRIQHYCPHISLLSLIPPQMGCPFPYPDRLPHSLAM